ncbi:MAG: mucoidy inhibitor MuiA family protein [Bacteroidales bacterium]|nr:mucoidy inhibitor MuiA family protein [Bacteroidales bacterium]
MKKVILMLALISFQSFIYADEKEVESKISDVTVFLQGAYISRTADIQLLQGTSELIFKGISTQLDARSIQVNAPDNVKILSVSHKINNHENVDSAPERKEFEKQRELKQFEIEKINKLLEVYSEEEKILLKNTDFSGIETGVNLEELKQAAAYFRIQLEETGMKKLELKKKKNDIQKQINELNSKIDELRNTKPDPTSEIIVKVDAIVTGKATLTLKYFVGSAGWTPYYDIRVDDIDEPLTLTVKAYINQRTGEDWEDVNLTLSTSNPKKGNYKPVFYTWYVNENPARYRTYSEPGGAGTIKGRIVDMETKKPIPFANIVIERGGSLIGGTTSDYKGNYIIKPIPSGTYDLKATYVGYKTVLVRGMVINADQIRFYDIEMESTAAQLEEIVITDYKIPLLNKDETVSGGTVTANEIQRMPNRNANAFATSVGGAYSADGEYGSLRGARGDQTVMYVDGVRILGSANLPKYSIEYNDVTKTETPTNIKYKIEIPYSIPSDGKNYSVHVKDIFIPAEYEYFCIPKLDIDAFLIAKITGWEDLNLLSGKSNIFYEGTYMGQSSIDAHITDDTLDLSIGRDKGIVVKREKIKDFKKSQTIGSNVKEYRGFEISIKNNKSAPVNVTVVDQFPISKTKDIEVDQIEISNAEFDKKNGKLTWKFVIDPQQSEKVEMKYSVKYPKNKLIFLE